MDKDVKYFVDQYSQGRRQISQLILDQGESVKAHVTNETEKLRQDLDKRFDNLQLTDINQDLVSRVLGSLKDSSTNLRRNQVAESYHGTFEWIFDKGIESPWDSFVEWLISDDRLYWISGKPGSGKSTLMKFIINETRTQHALNGWHPGCALLSAFLWRSGQEIQRSRKGLLSALVHQLLRGKASKVMEIVSSHEGIAHKTILSDWSTTELTDVLLNLIARSDDYICIFIDGLDEVGPEEDVHDLIKLVGTLRGQPKVKICVSSRPERPFQLAFGACSRLKLQDLTDPDIKHYIAGFLQPQTHLLEINNYPDNAIAVLTNLITDKAVGVFLWVELVLRSVRTGFTNGDNWYELLKRLELLPSNLHELYNQMWQRLNDDEPLYRKEAAFYFNAVIDSDCMLWQKPLFISDKGRPMILAITMAFHSSLVSAILDSRSKVSPERLAKLCIQTVSRIHIRAAGLLEISIPGEPSSDTDQMLSDLRRQGTRDQFDKLLRMEISFVHRTARDFLLETAEGREILKHDEISLEVQTIRLLRALAAGAVALRSPLTAGMFEPDIEKFLRILVKLEDSMSDNIEKYQKWKEMMVLLQDLFHHNALLGYSRLDFLGLAASHGFESIVSRSVMDLEEKALLPQGYENYLLRCAAEWYAEGGYRHLTDNEDIVMARWHAMFKAKSLVGWLLERGADPNAKFHHFDQLLSECTPFMTFLGNAIDQLKHWVLRDKHFLDIMYEWFVSVTKSFIDADANLDSVGYAFSGEKFGSYALPAADMTHLIPVLLSEMNAAHMIQDTLEIFHNFDAKFAASLDLAKFVAAKKSKRVTLAAWGVVGPLNRDKRPYNVLDLKFQNVVAVTEEDSLVLTDLLNTIWKVYESGRSPFEQSEFEGILQRGRPVEFRDYMEQVGVFLPDIPEHEYPPSFPGEPQTKRYTVYEAGDKLHSEGQYPPHTWFRD